MLSRDVEQKNAILNVISRRTQTAETADQSCDKNSLHQNLFSQCVSINPFSKNPKTRIMSIIFFCEIEAFLSNFAISIVLLMQYVKMWDGNKIMESIQFLFYFNN